MDHKPRQQASVTKPEVHRNRRSLGTVKEEGLHISSPHSFTFGCGFTAVRSLKVLPVCLALTALDAAEELLDESLGLCFHCGPRGWS